MDFFNNKIKIKTYIFIFFIEKVFYLSCAIIETNITINYKLKKKIVRNSLYYCL